jgi:hypothetical protein
MKKRFQYVKDIRHLAVLLIIICLNNTLPAQITITKTDALCEANNGTASASVNNGTPPYTYKWSNGKTTASINKLSPGSYTVTVTDAAGCKGKKSTTIKKLKGNISVNLSGGGEVPFCVQDGPPKITLTASASGGSPPYKWTPSSSRIVSGSGTYSFTVKDTNKCEGKASTVFTYIPIRCSRDPNEILGPEGYGPQQFVSSKNSLPYIINFENDPEFATAPAQRVEVRHVFDPHVNLYSLKLGDFGFRGMIFSVPPNSSSYSTRLDVRDSLGIYVDVTAGLDISTQTAFWIFQSIDPATGFPPNNPDVGFLPVNDSISHHGEGYVSFTVKPRNNTHTGDSLKASAVIVFDINPPLATNTWFNLADAVSPQSTVDLLPAAEYNTFIDLSFTATDDPGGSGIAKIEVFAAGPGEDFIKIGESHPDSSFRFSGPGCSLYRFYSIAIDNTGNTEALKTTADASTILNPAPEILTQPLNISANEGEDVTFSVSGTLGSFYTWEISTDGGFSFTTLTEEPPYQGVTTPLLQLSGITSYLNGNQYRCILSNGTCFTQSDPASLIIRASLSGLVQYDNGLLSPVSNTEVYLTDFTGTKTDSTTSNLSGSYLFDLIDPGNYVYHITPLKPWGGVNATDALKILRHFAQLETLSGLKFIAADVNNNHNINSVDGLLIARRFVGLTNTFPTGDWYSESDTLEIGTTQVTQNIRAICFGDADGSYIPGLKTSPSLSLHTSGEINCDKGSVVQIPFTLNRYVNAGALSLVLYYPSDQMEIMDILMAGSETSDDLIYTHENGIIRMAWYSIKPISLDVGDPLFTLIVNINDRPVSQNLDFVLDGVSEISDSKAKVESDLQLIMPKLKDERRPEELTLNQNYPNPFINTTEISYYLPQDAIVVLKVFNSTGQEITELLNAPQTMGWHKLQFDGSSLAAGTYPVKIDVKTGNTLQSKFRMMTKAQ